MQQPLSWNSHGNVNITLQYWSPFTGSQFSPFRKAMQAHNALTLQYISDWSVSITQSDLSGHQVPTCVFFFVCVPRIRCVLRVLSLWSSLLEQAGCWPEVNYNSVCLIKKTHTQRFYVILYKYTFFQRPLTGPWVCLTGALTVDFTANTINFQQPFTNWLGNTHYSLQIHACQMISSPLCFEL